VEHRLNQTKLDKELKRLRGYHGFAGFADELKRVVNRHAADDDHVTRVVNEIVETRKPNAEGFLSCPSPAEMIDYCMAVPDHADQQQAMGDPVPGCATCGGVGSFTRAGYTFACGCRFGGAA
jgi:hypothetical protein